MDLEDYLIPFDSEKSSMSNITASLLAMYTQSETTFKKLDMAVKTGENIILYGPPGYGKSEISKAFFEKVCGHTAKVVALGAGTTMAHLFGDTIMKEQILKDGRKIGVAYDKASSIGGHQAVILEEMFDTNPKVLQSLKDYFTRKQLCAGGECWKSDTIIHIACTNMDPRDWVESAPPGEVDSYQALVDRFFIRHRVEWEDHSSSAYAEMYNKQGVPLTADQVKELSTVFGACAKMSHKVSPRDAMKAVKVFQADPRDYLAYLSIPGHILSKIGEERARMLRVGDQEKRFRDLSALLKRKGSLQDRLLALTQADSFMRSSNIEPENMDLAQSLRLEINSARRRIEDEVSTLPVEI